MKRESDDASDLSNREEPAQSFMTQGQYDQAVITGSQMLEALYRWLYKEVQPRLQPQEQELISIALAKHGRNVADFTMDELTDFFEEIRLYDIAERELKRDFSFLKKASAWRDLRNRATQPQNTQGNNPVTAQEAETFLSTVDLYLHQAGLVVEERPKPTESKIPELRLRVQFPWDKMADFVRGVLVPLQQDGAHIDVEVCVTARSQEGLRKTTVDHKVREALNEIGAKILSEERRQRP